MAKDDAARVLAPALPLAQLEGVLVRAGVPGHARVLVGRFDGGRVERDLGVEVARGKSHLHEALADLRGDRADDGDADLTRGGGVHDIEADLEVELGALRAGERGGNHRGDRGGGGRLGLRPRWQTLRSAV